MDFELTKGCTCWSFTIDDVEEASMTDEQRRNALRYIAEHLSPEDLNYALQELVQAFGDYECDGIPCECCGDVVETYQWKL